MKALVYTGPHEMDFRDAADPVAAADEVIVRVQAVGICGSDMHGYHGHDARRPAPLILGHEAAGTIVGGPRDGERVTVNPLVTQGTSAACLSGRENICPDRQLLSMPPREGAFAQFIAVPERNLVTVPNEIGFDKAALVEPLAVAWHAAKLALGSLHDSSERRALVIGGGAIGLASALALRALGLSDITLSEPNEARRAFLEETCGERAVSKAEGLFPLVVDAVGYAATREIASACTEPGGVIAHVGLGEATGGLDIRKLTLQEITFIGTYCYTMVDFRETAEALFEGRLGDMGWFETRALSEGHKAFQDLDAQTVAAPKIVLTPWSS